MTISPTLLDRLERGTSLVVFTGAGMSAESGVPTFRAADGIWARFNPAELANVEAFLANPELVWRWYQSRREVILEARPNGGHRAIAELESIVPQVSVITQNIDGLHQEAGSSEVIELHGSIRRNHCQRCSEPYDDPSLLTATELPRCRCGGLVRPSVVWFGEMLPEEALALAERRTLDASVFFTIGTSAVVYPAAGFPLLARESGAYVVEINPEETPHTRLVHESIRSSATEALEEIVTRLKERMGRE